MIVRGLIAALAGTLVVASSGAFAATAKPKAPAAEVQLAANFPIYDRVVDPMTAAIRAMLATAGQEGAYLDKRDAAGVAEYYAEQGYAPTWTVDGRLTERAKKLIARLHEADKDGLVDVYRTPVIGRGEVVPASIEVTARAEVMLSRALVTYSRHANSGVLDPAAISQNFEYDRHLPDPVAVLINLATTTGDPTEALAAYNPTHPEFVALRDRLAEIRANEVERPPLVPPGKNLKLGISDARVVVLRERLKVTTSAPDPMVFDDDVDLAVKAFQEQAGLKPDGVVGPRTLGIMNAAADDHIATILANMERWRWMPHDLGTFYVRVNIPNFNLEIYRDDKVVYTTRIVVGQTGWQTPVFSRMINHVIVNPTWNVPASIAVKEMLPKIQSNPGALNGYQVFANIDGRFRAVDPMMVDWQTVDMRRIQIKQPPGERNALGSIKFMFPNPFSVYLHDTPSKSFFERDYRALSHGCMRVQNPWEFANALLADDPIVSTARLKKLVGGPETRVNLTNEIPVHITYFTAWVDETGELKVRDDIYGHDARIEKALGL
ncbi:MAG: L,D-transpeptidase family protein [Bauldia sp.]|nr:L,D-transpeptidase family protein [Bauldia sp.]